MNINLLAKICHEANRAIDEANGKNGHLSWDESPPYQQEAFIRILLQKMENPNWTAEDLHQSWVKDQREEGWTFGELLDASAKTHPRMVKYNELSSSQKTKDTVFDAIVTAVLND